MNYCKCLLPCIEAEAVTTILLCEAIIANGWDDRFWLNGKKASEFMACTPEHKIVLVATNNAYEHDAYKLEEGNFMLNNGNGTIICTIIQGKWIDSTEFVGTDEFGDLRATKAQAKAMHDKYPPIKWSINSLFTEEELR